MSFDISQLNLMLTKLQQFYSLSKSNKRGFDDLYYSIQCSTHGDMSYRVVFFYLFSVASILVHHGY